MKILPILFVFLLSYKENKIDAKNVEVNSVSKGTIINKQEPKNISGTWIYEKKSDSKIPEEMFTLKIIQTGDKIKAEYCAISNSGEKIDCDNDENFNVNGVIKNGKIFGEFYSFFGVTNDKGEFKIIINDDNTLEWSIIKAPKGEYYAPNNVILSRKSSLDNISEKINIVNLPLSKDKISILDYPTPEKYKNLQIDERTPTSVIEIEKNILILFFEGDNEYWYLVTLNNNKIMDTLLIGKSETVETDNGTIDNYIDFIIDKDYGVHLKYRSGKNIKDSETKNTEKYKINLITNKIVKII